MLHLFGLRRQDDGVPDADQAGGGFEKNRGDLTDLVVELLGVGFIIAPNTDDFSWKVNNRFPGK